MPVDALVNELIALGNLDDATVADLKRMQSDAAAGTLDADDESYLRSLHARLTGAPAAEPVDVPSDRLDDLTLAEWRDRALAAEADLSRLRDQLTTTPTGA